MDNLLNNYLFDAFSNASNNIFIYVTDLSTDLTRWSKEAVEFFGLEGEYIYDVKSKWPDYIHPEDREVFLSDIAAVYSGEKPQHDCEYRARNRQGEYSWVECKGSIVKDENGTPAIFAGIMTKIDHQSKYDGLTHLQTGYELSKLSLKPPCTLMLVGIDNFRYINSRQGVVYGNRVLVHLTKILQKIFPNEQIFRYGGDEFAICSYTLTPEQFYENFEKLYTTCKIADNLDGIDSFSVSGGLVTIEDDCDINEIITRAELCLSDAKEETTTHFAVYTSEIARKYARKNLISEHLVKCIKNNFEGFHLVFQPIMTADGKKVIGSETLLRWDPKNPEIGPCYPDEFIPLLEKNEGIIDVGYFIMKESIRQLAEWQKEYPNLRLSFNVSYVQLQDSLFISSIIRTVRRYKITPGTIIMELTESVLASDTDVVLQAFEQLHNNNVLVALDDFGTGNTSFWTMHNFPVDIIKLDQSFIRHLDAPNSEVDLAIVESIALLSKRIGYQTVAEGVETETIMDIVRKFDITALQGYLFSRPIPADAYKEFLDSYNSEK